MRFPSHLVALAALYAAGPSQAQILVNELSFGQSGRLNAENGKIPHFTIAGQPQQPEILSNKIILTPMDPGNQRSSIWSDSPLTRSTWVADVDFRASGPDRAGGNLNIWFARRGKEEVGTNSVYTAGKFDGLVLVIDSHGGSGGMIRGFLNDGTVDYVSQPSVDKLAFGQCNYFYRNLGRPSQIKFRQTASNFKVEVDGYKCFETDKVSLPPGNYFGITAATPETPDSFEVFKLVVMSDSTVSGEGNQYHDNAGHGQHQHDDNHGQQVQHTSNDGFDDAIPDQSADIFHTSKEQFADLHNRLQSATHQINAVYNAVSKHHQMDEARHDEVKKALDSLRHELAAIRQTGDLQAKIKELEFEIHSMHNDMRQKLTAHGESLEANLRNHHSTLSEALTDSIPGHGKLMVFFVGTQIVLLAAYIMYKRRKANSPKKYL
ncbi:Legume-like lectin [Metarhizium rileyi]|uniref:Legume-like lectin n=1 Tax=Metarhizium rileyi (strain RCEF 4871) TaxID=1649241 RepID=A0A166ZZ71_METRR|nr:Legume-like lectin [Metarhizium rileyi RCEF 4871]TWU73317.1 hypothetical protein ED733_004238 [Metarhizium rileyi]